MIKGRKPSFRAVAAEPVPKVLRMDCVDEVVRVRHEDRVEVELPMRPPPWSGLRGTRTISKGEVWLARPQR